MTPGRRRIFTGDDRPLAIVARNVSSRYAAILVDAAIGLLMLPFNVAHLGASAYGLWMLTASLTVHVSVLDIGYTGSLVRFVAYYRAKGSARALNEIASTMVVVFAAIGLAAYLLAVGIAFHLDALFTLTPEQAAVGFFFVAIGSRDRTLYRTRLGQLFTRDAPGRTAGGAGTRAA